MEKRNKFSGSIGFVLAAAGSAVGLGNIWRFPNLAAKNGGGLFLVVYLILALSFGFTLLITEVSIGRKTNQSSLTAYGKLNKKFGWLGVFSAIVPFLILPYYCIVGGWVLKYAVVFITGNGTKAAQDGYFVEFISDPKVAIAFDFIFLLATCFVIYRGVNKGIESLSKILMPVLLVIVVGIAIFSLTIKNEETGVTGLEGLKYYVVPNVEGFKLSDYCRVIMDAMGQLFYSISVAMGIMVTYGSYFKKEDNLIKSVNRIEIFDTIVAFLAGVMIIPAVYVFMGKEGMTGGAGLVFMVIPKVFQSMGGIGQFVGALFFLMVLFAALTSSISVLEAVVSGMIDKFGTSRKKAVISEGIIALIIGIIICFGYKAKSIFYMEVDLPNGAKGQQLLDVVDYLANNIFMPVVAIGTCILIGWVVKPKTVIDEASINGEKFGRKKLFTAMITVIAPILLTLLLLISLGVISFD
ncbi:neurotransmitter:Na+ symporter, NSS family [Eubacterium ruminantium]|uniref:Neurotransmitter:Na+ symporter, NSS family n=1 Tax=Eubacterium ruminantium TaxID=42322 RepID=A0A1T4L3U2_9FIRM|nr:MULTISPECIES: sodium-dependent transporter [Eubacterium]MCR5368150.1 sodium-dependent transporter [Eubacterium sp.]SCW43049.1 neurotransmitter:Na+ symporter, NSS family [Eubacterium ruminantium]SDM81458.1 neurotransmitter:Na+ symporter, NSS family [Eubacterium ruminantium]SJZ49180.1 neurotransmitter:Na+ symporter, NSS family [Eubacterium ruminantium]